MTETTTNSTITLRFATRDDNRVAKAIYDREEIDSLHTLDSAGLLDGLLVFMNHIGFMDALKRFNIVSYKRMILPLVQFTLTYMTKILLDIPSMNAMPEMLFANCATLKIILQRSFSFSGGAAYAAWGVYPENSSTRIRGFSFT
ncbi:MAG: hypothetical protein HPY71_08885 [Firmicutes bacterium]|nr:hypothetical protein [Bacillota bacterium]